MENRGKCLIEVITDYNIMKYLVQTCLCNKDITGSSMHNEQFF